MNSTRGLTRRTFVTHGLAVTAAGGTVLAPRGSPPGPLAPDPLAPDPLAPDPLAPGPLALGPLGAGTARPAAEAEHVLAAFTRAAPTPFTLGVASGDPSKDGMVLWTRLALDPTAPDGRGGMPRSDVTVEWQLARDEGFVDVVRSGAEVARAAGGHSVHVEPAGLDPGREYFYRFRTGGHLSPAGRTRTAPAAASGTPVHVAVASCSNYEHGYFTAYRRLAESGPDLVVHLGDYLYESRPGSGRRVVRAHSGARATTLGAYRLRHAQYKSDPDLQAAHAAAPWIVAYDDHDVLDNWAGEKAARTTDQAAFAATRAAAMQAYYENMPLRAASLPGPGHMQMFRRISWGTVAAFHVLDTRQYRDPPVCGSGLTPACAGRSTPSRSMLGAVQEAWLADGLRASGAAWDVLAQQIFLSPNQFQRAPKKPARRAGWNMDTWDGYVAARGRLLAAVTAAGVRNPVVLSGDVHSAWAGEILRDFGGDSYDPVGVELVTSSISSGGNGQASTTWGRRALATHPHLKFFDRRRGWIAVRASESELRADYQVVPYVMRPGAPASTAASFVVESGRPVLNRV